MPGSPRWNAGADTASRAMRLIADGVVEREGVPGLAARLGVPFLGEIPLHIDLRKRSDEGRPVAFDGGPDGLDIVAVVDAEPGALADRLQAAVALVVELEVPQPVRVAA